MNKREVLLATTFGKTIAEQEQDELSSYFVETEQWRRIFAGDVDVIYGPKGSGKSAIYSLLFNRKDLLERTKIIAAENLRGTPVFKDLVEDPPTSEREFIGLWKLYFLSLIGDEFRKSKFSQEPARRVLNYLEEARLLPKEMTLSKLLRSVLDYARQLTKIESVEAGPQLDPITGVLSGLTGKITLREPSGQSA